MPSDTIAAKMRSPIELNFSTVMQVLILLVSLTGWAVSASNRSEQAGKDLSALQIALTNQIDQLRVSTATGLNDVRLQISTLPDQRARLDQAERRLVDINGRLDEANKRLSEVEHSTIQATSDVANLNRALARGR